MTAPDWPSLDPELARLLAESQAAYDAMTPEEQDEMWKAQREGYARAEASWPRPKFRIVDGVKVYDSYEDYCNG